MIAVDCVRSPSNAALQAADVTAVCRYLSWQGSRDTLGKVIAKPEYDRLVSGGIGVLLNWEYAATDWLGGASAGTSHGTEAVRQAQALGHPAGRAIAGSADFDMSSGQWSSAGRAYAVAYASAVRAGGYVAGVYGPYDVLTWCRDTGLFGAYWQAGMSTAWSGGRNRNVWPGVHLRQVHQQTIGGVDCDVNEIHQADFGQYPGGSTVELTSVVPNSGGRDVQTMLLDLWSGEQRDDSAAAPGAQTVRQRHLADLKTAVTAVGVVTLSDAQVTALGTAVGAALAGTLGAKLDEVLAKLAAAGAALES